jgi:DNA-binding response OmpR family regulator
VSHGENKGLLAVAAVDDPSSVETIKQSFHLCLPEYDLQFVDATKDCMSLVSSRRPDIVLIDRFINEADGFTILRSVRSICSAPVIMFSYGREEGTVVNAFDSGADGFLTKPLRQMELVAFVKRLVGRNHQ